MLRQFDTEEPTFVGAIEANPGAMGEHFLWNARLLPEGVELVLTSRDYDSPLALVGLAVALAVAVTGLVLLWRQRRRWWNDWIRERIWGWVALGSLAAGAVVVAIAARPAHYYLFGLEVFLLALLGISAMAIADRWPVLPASGRRSRCSRSCS